LADLVGDRETSFTPFEKNDQQLLGISTGKTGGGLCPAVGHYRLTIIIMYLNACKSVDRAYNTIVFIVQKRITKRKMTSNEPIKSSTKGNVWKL
jgi:hypothetical protein